MADLAGSPLGHVATYRDAYDPSLLYPVERASLRAELGIEAAVPFTGEDIWNAYELSWLDGRGKPQIAIATFRVPCSSPAVVESKSVKLYLTAFNQTRFESIAEVERALVRDLAHATGTQVGVELTPPERFASLPRAELAGECLDSLPLHGDTDRVAPDALVATAEPARATLFTRLFRSVCPVTGQPDYATVEIAYAGPRIDPAGLLRYLVSFRRQPGFHEHCVERIYVDVMRRCAPHELAVYARFTRRGGIDINPLRTSSPLPARANVRTARQ